MSSKQRLKSLFHGAEYALWSSCFYSPALALGIQYLAEDPEGPVEGGNAFHLRYLGTVGRQLSTVADGKCQNCESRYGLDRVRLQPAL